MSAIDIEVNKIYENFKEQALERNDLTFLNWFRYKNELDDTKYLLSVLPKKVKHDVMVPIGPNALMPGKLVHTNEFLVNLGETWFAKRTASQTIEICNRRIKACDEMIEKLEKERELILNKSYLPTEQDAFGNNERPEIIEYVTEEENENWKKQHRIKEKEYRKQLAELKNKDKKVIETEEDLWKRLDELELQEELEDELNRLHSEDVSEDSLEENLELDETSIPSSSTDKEKNVVADRKKDSPVDSSITVNNAKVKRKVSFASDLDLEDEPLRLEIKHSDVEPVPSDPNSKEINSPSDIYNYFLMLLKKNPVSVLKSDKNPNREKELEIVKVIEECDFSEDEQIEEHTEAVSSGIQLNDVFERHSLNSKGYKNPKEVSKKVSKFKSSRIRKSW